MLVPLSLFLKIRYNFRFSRKCAPMRAPDIPMRQLIDDVRILETLDLIPASALLADLPAEDALTAHIHGARESAGRIIHGGDDRLIVVVGPCSIHDRQAALEYGRRLAKEAERHKERLLIVMRVYFEKPRTTVGWKGLINDPNLDGTFAINDGLRLARAILLDLNRLGLPCGAEFLDVVSPQYIADLVSWGAIGARTTESQVHRELASGLSCPVGFKNGTDGNVKIAADALRAASQPHHFLSATKDGRAAISRTMGNDCCHIILRGGDGKPNYDAESVESAVQTLARNGLPGRLMIDCSHANSGKDHRRQPEVCANVAKQVAGGDVRIIGVMIESNLVEGRQELERGKELVFGQSVTDACIDWEATERALENLAEAVETRRRGLRDSE